VSGKVIGVVPSEGKI